MDHASQPLAGPMLLAVIACYQQRAAPRPGASCRLAAAMTALESESRCGRPLADLHDKCSYVCYHTVLRIRAMVPIKQTCSRRTLLPNLQQNFSADGLKRRTWSWHQCHEACLHPCYTVLPCGGRTLMRPRKDLLLIAPVLEWPVDGPGTASHPVIRVQALACVQSRHESHRANIPCSLVHRAPDFCPYEPISESGSFALNRCTYAQPYVKNARDTRCRRSI